MHSAAAVQVPANPVNPTSASSPMFQILPFISLRHIPSCLRMGSRTHTGRRNVARLFRCDRAQVRGCTTGPDRAGWIDGHPCRPPKDSIRRRRPARGTRDGVPRLRHGKRRESRSTAKPVRRERIDKRTFDEKAASLTAASPHFTERRSQAFVQTSTCPPRRGRRGRRGTAATLREPIALNSRHALGIRPR